MKEKFLPPLDLNPLELKASVQPMSYPDPLIFCFRHFVWYVGPLFCARVPAEALKNKKCKYVNVFIRMV